MGFTARTRLPPLGTTELQGVTHMIPGRHRAFEGSDAGSAAIDSRRLTHGTEADLSADPDEAAVLGLLADVLVGDNHWTVGEVRRLLDLRDSTRGSFEAARPAARQIPDIPRPRSDPSDRASLFARASAAGSPGDPAG